VIFKGGIVRLSGDKIQMGCLFTFVVKYFSMGEQHRCFSERVGVGVVFSRKLILENINVIKGNPV
jgi:hypothetical protein